MDLGWVGTRSGLPGGHQRKDQVGLQGGHQGVLHWISNSLIASTRVSISQVWSRVVSVLIQGGLWGWEGLQKLSSETHISKAKVIWKSFELDINASQACWFWLWDFGLRTWAWQLNHVFVIICHASIHNLSSPTLWDRPNLKYIESKRFVKWMNRFIVHCV